MANSGQAAVELTPNPVVAFGLRLARDEMIAAPWRAFWSTPTEGAFLLAGAEWPGGKADPGENFATAVVRENRETTRRHEAARHHVADG